MSLPPQPGSWQPPQPPPGAHGQQPQGPPYGSPPPGLPAAVVSAAEEKWQREVGDIGGVSACRDYRGRGSRHCCALQFRWQLERFDRVDRGFGCPNFDPENARVTTYIDYENGIVVMRQNPSIQLGPDGGPGQVKVGAPQGTVTQLPDGSVRIRYDAGNPFAPGISAKIPDHPWTVNGDLVVTPGPQGVHVDGTRTDYPSMEVYQDLPNGSTHTVLIDPAQSARSLGPFLNLTGHHDVGVGGRAFEPFDRGAWNPRYDVRVPLPSTDFGPVSSPPSVPTPRPGPGIPA